MKIPLVVQTVFALQKQGFRDGRLRGPCCSHDACPFSARQVATAVLDPVAVEVAADAPKEVASAATASATAASTSLFASSWPNSNASKATGL